MEWAGDDLGIPATMIVLFSLLGLASSLFVTPTEAEGDPAPFRLNAFADVGSAIGELQHFRALFLVVLGIAWHAARVRIRRITGRQTDRMQAKPEGFTAATYLKRSCRIPSDG